MTGGSHGGDEAEARVSIRGGGRILQRDHLLDPKKLPRLMLPKLKKDPLFFL